MPETDRRTSPAVAESAYRHVIENAISGVGALSTNREEALIYLLEEWLPFALGCQKTWREALNGAEAPRCKPESNGANQGDWHDANIGGC